MARLSLPSLGFTKSAEDRDEYSKDAARSRKTIVGFGILHFSCTAMIVIKLWEDDTRKTNMGNILSTSILLGVTHCVENTLNNGNKQQALFG